MNHRIPLCTAAAAAIAAAACSKEATGSSEPVFCEATVDNLLQSGTDLVATGTFDGGQPIISLGQTVVLQATNYTGSTATFDLTGVPPGTYSVKLDVSCDQGSSRGTVKTNVASITIH